jgi:hypothetical protein
MKTYNAKHIVVKAAGVQTTGMGEDGFVTVKAKTPVFSTKVGADGLVIRSQSPDGRVEIEVKMLAASPSNAHYQALFDLDRGSGVAPFPFEVEDLHGTVVSTSPVAWVTKAPDLTGGKESGEVTWVLEAESAETKFGGAAY